MVANFVFFIIFFEKYEKDAKRTRTEMKTTITLKTHLFKYFSF